MWLASNGFNRAPNVREIAIGLILIPAICGVVPNFVQICLCSR